MAPNANNGTDSFEMPKKICLMLYLSGKNELGAVVCCYKSQQFKGQGGKIA